MIKGVNKAVVEVNGIEGEFFEKAVFYLKPEHVDTNSEKLKKKAREYIAEQEKPTVLPFFECDLQAERKRHRRLFFILSGYLALVATVITLLILFL